MSSLYHHLRIHQVFGANTNVGKTILTTALIRQSAHKRRQVFYLKPVSTGSVEDADDLHINRFSGPFSDLIHTECLYRYKEPVSPHLAARSDNTHSQIPSDDVFINAISNSIRTHATSSLVLAHMYVETAGGVHSPCLSGTTQADCYRPLFLPTILIGDSKLGGISATISAYESLLLRGYIIDAVLLFKDEYYCNWEYLQSYFAERGVYFSTIRAPPKLLSDPSANFRSTEDYYESLTSPEQQYGISPVVDHLDKCHSQRIQTLQSMPRRTLDSIWWPFVQHSFHANETDVNVIDSACKDFFSVSRTDVSKNYGDKSSILNPQFDGSASWWTQTLGHAHSSLTLAAARASGRYGHVMFPQATHMPALKLAERLIKDGPGQGWASRAFISDNGSTGMEVAIKMALRAFTVRHGLDIDAISKKKLGILGLKGSYHGDTIGAMDACEEGVYTCEWHDAKGYWFDPPTIGIRDGKTFISVPGAVSSAENPTIIQTSSLNWVYNVEERLLTPLSRVYASYVQRTLDNLQRDSKIRLAALVIEPLVMGAGGMIFVDPLFQRVMIDIVRGGRASDSLEWSGLPVIFDEVFVGLHRIGMKSTAPLLGVNPDICVNAKVLTGGLVPLAVTLASKSIFQAFWCESKIDALLHGHSYTAHPIGCEVANETLDIIEKITTSEEWKAAQRRWDYVSGKAGSVWSLWDPHFINKLSKNSKVKEVMTLGSVLAVKINGSADGYASSSAEKTFETLKEFTEDNSPCTSAPGGAPFSIHFRTLGNVAYFMTSLNTTSSVIRSVEDKIWDVIIKQ